MRKKGKLLFIEKDYISASELLSCLGLNATEKRKKFHLILNELFENNVCYQDEEGQLCPLVEEHHAKGRFPKYFAVKNEAHPLFLIARILRERGLDVYYFQEGYSSLQLRDKLSNKYGLLKISRKLEQLYRLGAQFEDEKGFVSDLVIKYKRSGAFYLLNTSEKAFEIFKEKMQKTKTDFMLTPAQIAGELGLHKGWGTCIEWQLSRMYQFNHVYYDAQGCEQALIQKYVIGGKERFFLSADPNAISLFRKIYMESRQKNLLSDELMLLKKKNRAVFSDELQESFDKGILFQKTDGKFYPLIEKKFSVTKGCQLVVCPDPEAYKVFSERLKTRFNNHLMQKKNLSVTSLVHAMNRTNHHVFCFKEVLKMLYAENICYMDSDEKVQPLVVKKNERYFLMPDQKALDVFKTHLEAFIQSYGRKTRNYYSFSQLISLLDSKITSSTFCNVLEDMQKEGIMIPTQKGEMLPIVQRFRLKNNVMPFLNNSPQALQLLKEKIKSREC